MLRSTRHVCRCSLIFHSVSEDGAKAQAQTEEMEISTRSRGKNTLTDMKNDIYIYKMCSAPSAIILPRVEVRLWNLWPSPALSDSGPSERGAAQKRKMPSPSHSSNGHSSAETSPCQIKKKKKPGALGGSKDQVTSQAGTKSDKQSQSWCLPQGSTPATIASLKLEFL